VNVILFGGTGMVGSGALRELLLDPGVERVLLVGRRPSGRTEPKIRELVLPDLSDFSALAEVAAEYDACFFCLGVTAAGMSEADYRKVTYDLTLAAAEALAGARPAMTFVYVSGEGSDSTEKGRVMWARVRGETENALLRLPLRTYVLRPGFIQPANGEVSRTRWYRIVYAATRPLYPLLKRLAPGRVTTTEHVGRAMLALAREDREEPILHSRDINALG
jgi:uncharacterized protein YbjT (DUF2867 family)